VGVFTASQGSGTGFLVAVVLVLAALVGLVLAVLGVLVATALLLLLVDAGRNLRVISKRASRR
jgi:hypothetical protein